MMTIQRRKRFCFVILPALALSLMAVTTTGCVSQSEVVRLETEIKILQEEIALLQREQDRLKRSYGALRKNYVRNIETVGSRLVETSVTAEDATVKANVVDQRVDELAESVLEIESRYQRP